MPKLARTRCALSTMLIGTLLVSCRVSDATPQQRIGQTVAPTVHSTAVDIGDLVAGQALSYRGITPGASSKADVLAKWGEPNVTRRYEAYESLHYFDEHFSHDGKREYFLVKDEIIVAVTSNAEENWLVKDGELARNDDLEQVLGSPEVFRATLGGFDRQVFPEYGLAVTVNYDPYPYQFFVPTSLQEYQELWGKYPLECDPFPLIPSVEDVGITPGETTRAQVEQLLGIPDRILFEDAGDPWVYYVEPIMLGQLFVDFDSDSVVESMSIWRRLRDIPLSDVVERYGEPDILQLVNSQDGIEYMCVGLVYLDRGLRVTTMCNNSQACEAVQEDDIVRWTHYFEPTTLEEYKARFPEKASYDPAYAEWHGFDE